MMSNPASTSRFRILFLADTHLGFDLPVKPRIDRHRGVDFFTNVGLALEPAFRGEVDLVIHGGDLLYRSRVPLSLVSRALEPLLAVADAGVPVFIVPGNHERSKIPFPLVALHPRVHLFDQPRTFRLEKNGLILALTGFPYERSGIRDRLGTMIDQGGSNDIAADIRLLCLHHVVEGARVGVHNYTFRHGEDVIRGREIPAGFAAILSGHIHRHQVLTHDLEGSPLATPVFYPGSIERTAFDERLEPKGFLLIEVGPGDRPGGNVDSWRFRELPTRPMVVREIDLDVVGEDELESRLAAYFKRLDPRSVVSLRFSGTIRPAWRPLLHLPRLRSFAPASMILSLRLPQ